MINWGAIFINLSAFYADTLHRIQIYQKEGRLIVSLKVSLIVCPIVCLVVCLPDCLASALSLFRIHLGFFGFI